MVFLFKQIKENLQQKIIPFFVSTKFNVVLIIIGVILRLEHYLENRALWLDEAYVGVQLTGASFIDVLTFKPYLSSQPQQPLLFSLISKISAFVFGNNEYAYRLLPLVASIVSLILFYRLIKLYLTPKVVPIALGLFVFCERLVYFSAELKPYSSDVATNLVLLLVAIWVFNKKIEIKKCTVLLYVGIAAMLFWHVSVFALAPIGLFLIINAKLDGRKPIFSMAIKVCILWIICFVNLYKLCFSGMLQNQQFIEGNILMAPHPRWSIETIAWFFKTFIALFKNPVGIHYPYLGVILCVVGGVCIFREKRQDFILFVLPLTLAFLAGFLHKYPSGERFLLFFIPVIFLFIAKAIEYIAFKKSKMAVLLAAILVVVLFYSPVKKSSYYFFNDRPEEQSRQVMNYLKKNYRDGDYILMNVSAQFPFWYYSCQLDMKDKKIEGAEKYSFLSKQPKMGVLYDDLGFLGEDVTAAFWKIEVDIDEKGAFQRVSYEEDELFIIKEQGIPNVMKNKRIWLLLVHSRPELEIFLLSSFSKNSKNENVSDFLKANKASIFLYQF